MGGLTRADVLRRGVLGGLTLGISGSIAALTASRAAAGEEPPSDDQEADLALVRMSASSELLAIDFYSRALGASRHLTSAERANLADLRHAEREHYAALAALLGDTPPVADDFYFYYPAKAFSSHSKIASTGAKLETTIVGIYLGAVGSLADPGLRALAAQLAASDARHAGVLAEMSSGDAAGASFPVSLDVEQASELLAPYLGAR